MTRLYTLILFLCIGSCSYLEGQDLDHRESIEPVSVEIRDTPHGISYNWTF